MSVKEAPPPELLVFLVTPSSNLNGPAADLSDINGVSCRRRKKHTKSHLGCVACKKRRVKVYTSTIVPCEAAQLTAERQCDNSSPSCRSCTRRSETCSLSSSLQGLGTLTNSSMNKRGLSPQWSFSSPSLAELDGLQVYLFHNFVKSTVMTLPFGCDIWQEGVAALALEHDYLMHAVLLISAKHLSSLFPNNLEYRRASLFHLSKVLPRYREEVSKPLLVENADFAMAASFLMIYYTWADIETFNMTDDACFINDRLFAMTGGLRETFISAAFLISSGQSIFSESIAHRPTDTVENLAQRCSQAPKRFEQSFCEKYYARGDEGILNIQEDSGQRIPEFSKIRAAGQQVDNNDLWYSVTQPHDPCLIGFLEASVRLAPLCSIASEIDVQSQDGEIPAPKTSQNEGSSEVNFGNSLPMADLARYIFSWPYVSSPGVLHLLAVKDECMICLLYHFYKIIKTILPGKYWWAHQRADKMMPILKDMLSEGLLNPQSSSQALTIPLDVVTRATNFASEANKAWRHYCILYGLEAKSKKG